MMCQGVLYRMEPTSVFGILITRHSDYCSPSLTEIDQACSTWSEETENTSIQPTKSEKQVDQVSHIGVGPRSGNIP